MKTIEHNGHKIEVFNGADNLPMKRYQRFNKFLMLDVEVGSSFEDYDRRTAKAVEFLKKKMIDEAIQEIHNRRQMVYNAFQEYSPKNNALVILIHSIDGEVFTDYSADGLSKVIDKLDEIGFTQNQVTETVTEVKKKSKINWLCTFLNSLVRRKGRK